MLFGKKPILICGGGIGGLTLGNCLKKAKIDFHILEKAKKYVDIGGGIGLWGPALKALNSLGLEDELKQQGKMMDCAGYRNFNHIDSTRWLVKPAPMLDRHTSCLTLRRSSLQNTLLKNVRNDILNNAKVSKFTQNADSVQVTLENGQTIEGSFLIGADGINSVIRNILYPNIAPKDCGYYYWQGVCNVDHSNLVTGQNKRVDYNFPAFEAWHPGIRFGAVPLKNPELFWFFASDYCYNEQLNEREVKNYLIEKAKKFGETASHIVEITEEASIQKYDMRDINGMKSWGNGRVMLLGDAVHAMAPNLAQGACLSIEDALELAHQLYKHKDNSPTFNTLNGILTSYEQSRIPRAKTVQTLVPLVHKVGTAYKPYNLLRNYTFKGIPTFLKTTVFDKTHQLALGFSYTPPNLGDGLYYRLLGKDFIEKYPVLRTFHKDDVDRYVNCSVSVKRYGLLSRALASLFSLPSTLENGYVELKVTSTLDGKEIWDRTYYTLKNNEKRTVCKFITEQSLYQEELLEKTKSGIFLVLKQVKKDSQFDLVSQNWGIEIMKKRIFLPKLFMPKIVGITKILSDTQWEFDIKISSPRILNFIIGDVVNYKGSTLFK